MLRPSPLPCLVIALAAGAVGCAGWGLPRYDLSKLQDERVGDIERRLDRKRPVVASPFGEPSGVPDELHEEDDES